MSTRKQNKAIQNFQQIWQLSKVNREKNIIQWFLRGLLVVGRQPNYPGTGFVLPTTVLLLVVASLTVAALLVRSSSRTNQVILERQQQRITNAATPAIDRAKSKLEQLFNDKDYPNGIPAEGKLAQLMGNDAIYTLRGERRINIGGTTALDNAWTYDDPATGDTVAYSIIMKTATELGEPVAVNLLTGPFEDTVKAKALIVRNGPLTPAQLNPNCQVQDEGLESGWFQDNSSTSILRKNFQVNAVVLPKNNDLDKRPYSTLEFQQDRRVERGNKWAAWFRNDLEIFPGPNFTLNGAIYTQGSLFLGSPTFSSHLISSPSSCLYGIDGIKASEININEQLQTIGVAAGTVDYRSQVVSGTLRDNTFLANSSRVYQSPNFASGYVQLTNALSTPNSNDSVLDGTLTPALLALDPLTVFTLNISRSRNTADLGNLTVRDPNWSNNPLATGSKQRIFQQKAPTPYLDDTYRADNRYGPNVLEDALPVGRRAGDTITTADPNFLKLTLETPPSGNNPEELGLDGYWERRSRYEGLRVIVGQRLELGNQLPAPTALPAARPHEALQRRTLRDNTAAVQATAIYHHENDKDFPIACLATTVHPGTAETLSRSATFEEITFKNSLGADVTLQNDFFTGRGTNGWEYDIPNLASDLNNPNSSMQKALRNLAYFAGDPDGAYPPKQETSASILSLQNITHPYVGGSTTSLGLTTLGDFSNLRRALLAPGNVPTTYATLSIADQSYIHTAACSLGMLADNIKMLNDYSYVANVNASVVDVAASSQLLDDLNAELSNTAIYTNTNTPPREPLKAIAALQNMADTGPVAERPKRAKLAQLARLISLKEQVELDRTKAKGYTILPTGIYTCEAAKFAITPAATALVKLCPPRVGSTYTTNDIKYPVLYYIFPTIDHAEERTDTHITTNVNNTTLIPIPYKGTNFASPTVYDPIQDDATLESIRVRPRTIGTNWKLDTELVSTPVISAPNSQQNELISYVNNSGITSVYRVPFKDSALFNGREMMNVRVLNLDLDLLRRNKPLAGDTWLPADGLVFAFREDGLREGSIARPEIGPWLDYITSWYFNLVSGPPNSGTPIWRMNAATTRRDPPLNPGTGISPKPIDYYPDPDRRPYGFRLKNGRNIARQGLASGTTFAGLSFISDNPVYIQGDFNLHQTAGGVLIEEFTDLLATNWSNFYNRSTINTNFAKDADSWRPSEILADAVTILSNNYCDGSIEDGFTTAGTGNTNANALPAVDYAPYGCVGTTGPTSYMNQNRPNQSSLNPTLWTREDPADVTSPIKISENGTPGYGGPPVFNNAYFNFDDAKPLIVAAPTRVNTMIVGGIVPSRATQSFGGLHNFPRFLENWGGVDLRIAGSFIQLGFSTSATGPFDQDAWESTQSPATNENIRYYSPPNRLWGYDVGQQYRPAGPVARRFTVPSPARSEFYKELSAEDAYIKRLRCAIIPVVGTRVDPNVTGCN